MPPRRILILGGTGEARTMASHLIAEGFAPTTSLAGVTQAPLMPSGDVHVGGFGGAAGLAAYIKREGIAALVDATHPFAVRISRHAASAAHDCAIPLLRFERPAWRSEEGDKWIEVAGVTQAVSALPPHARPMVTVGRKEIGLFFAQVGARGVARMIEAPAESVPTGWTLLLERPPSTLAAEKALMQKHRISHLVTKNAGGSATRAKIDAARDLQIPLIMIARPEKPKAETFTDVAQLAPLLRVKLSP